MRRLTERLAPGSSEPGATLTLPFELRQRSRLRARLDDGEEVAVQLPRGSRLRGGDLLGAGDGGAVRVRAAEEEVSRAAADDPLLLARACYHLGNRHVALEIGPGWIRYPRDHVLDALVRELGLPVTLERAPFEPETGAYHSHGRADHG